MPRKQLADRESTSPEPLANKRKKPVASESTTPKPAAKRHRKASTARAVTPVSDGPCTEDIARLAHMLWESRNYGGSPEGDWLLAEGFLKSLPLAKV